MPRKMCCNRCNLPHGMPHRLRLRDLDFRRLHSECLGTGRFLKTGNPQKCRRCNRFLPAPRELLCFGLLKPRAVAGIAIALSLWVKTSSCTFASVYIVVSLCIVYTSQQGCCNRRLLFGSYIVMWFLFRRGDCTIFHTSPSTRWRTFNERLILKLGPNW